MLHLYGCAILVDKSLVYINVYIYPCSVTLNLSIKHEVVLLRQYYIMHLERCLPLRRDNLPVTRVSFRYEYLLCFIYFVSIF